MSRRGRSRGAALVELAITAPLLIACLVFGLYFTELIHEKLELQELTRSLAWELTSYTLSDYGSGDSEGAFEAARLALSSEVGQRYPARAGFALRVTAPEVTFENSVVVPRVSRRFGVRAEGGTWSNRALALASRGLSESLARWRFNTKGLVTVQARVRAFGTLLSRPPLGSLELRSRYSLIADGWTLPDGGDSVVDGGRAGNHRGGRQKSGLYTQVARMHWLGDSDFAKNVSFLRSASAVLPVRLPNLGGTFVVSHNYGPIRGRSCQGIPGYPGGDRGGQDARGGLSDLAPLLDIEKPGCFDTAPLRDTQKYADSLYGRIFAARGNFFMGCQRAQADDPSAARDTTSGDRSTQRVNCEDER